MIQGLCSRQPFAALVAYQSAYEIPSFGRSSSENFIPRFGRKSVKLDLTPVREFLSLLFSMLT
jgi:hypothetical protein